MEALLYLRTKVHEIVNHADPDEAREFENLARVLLPATQSNLPKLATSNPYDGPKAHDSQAPAPEAGNGVPAEPGPEHFLASPELGFGGPIARPAGASFPPPASPSTDDDEPPSAIDEGELHRAVTRSLLGHDASESYRSFTPPPAPVLQNQVPIRYPRGSSVIPVILPPTSVTSHPPSSTPPIVPVAVRQRGPAVRQPAPEPEDAFTVQYGGFQDPMSRTSEEWRLRYAMYQALLIFLDPEAKEPQDSIGDMISHDHHPEDAPRWY